MHVVDWVYNSVREFFLVICLCVCVCVFGFNHVISHSNQIESLEAPENTVNESGGDGSRVFWFVQLSDLHISVHKRERVEDLDAFLGNTLADVIKPAFVVVSGDITDAKIPSFGGRITWTSKQFQEEWKMYQDVLQKHNMHNPAKWLDVRGNHDSYGVASWDDGENYFRQFSVSSSRENVNVLHYEPAFGGRYSVVSFDASREPSFRFPLGFYGQPNESMLNTLQMEVDQARQSNHTLLVGHYPMVTIHEPSGVLDSLMASDHIFAYLNGHLHMHEMYSRLDNGLFELELADWKTQRAYRIVAIDEDVVSFVDTRMGVFPVVLCTTPKDARFLSAREPYHRQKHSRTMRCLIFSRTSPVDVQASVDNGKVSIGQMHPIAPGSPLYTVEWDPTLIGKGLHSLHIAVQLPNHPPYIHTIPFSLDGTIAPLGVGISQFIQAMHFPTLFEVFFWLTYVHILVLLLGSRCVLSLYQVGWREQYNKWDKYMQKVLLAEHSPLGDSIRRDKELPNIYTWQLQSILWRYGNLQKKLVFLCSVLLVWPIVLPLYVGPLMKEDSSHMAFLLWGVYVDQGWVAVKDVFPFPTFHVVCILLAITVYSAQSTFTMGWLATTDKKYMSNIRGGATSLFAFLILFLFGIVTVHLNVMTALAFGYISALVSPCVFPLTLAACCIFGYTFGEERKMIKHCRKLKSN